jgi:hypothetical protein
MLWKKNGLRKFYLVAIPVISLILAVLVSVISGCSSVPVPIPTKTPMTSAVSTVLKPTMSSGGFQFGGGWPEDIPEEIPPLEGDIRVVVEGPDFIRIDYDKLTDDQRTSYLETLESQSFTLKGFVYTQEGFPDNSSERISHGDYDGVDITKNQYHMKLEYGAEQASYWIYFSGWRDTPISSSAMAPSYPWPQDISGKVPPPDGCLFINIVELNGGGYQVSCFITIKGADLAYLDMLKKLAFSEKDKLLNDEGKLIETTLTNGSFDVKLSFFSDTHFFVQIKPSLP